MQVTDSYFRVDTEAYTPIPQTVIWRAMHQDYCEGYVFLEDLPGETQAGEWVVKHLLRGDRGHYGPLEHPCITLAVGFFPHSVMQQLRTHRTGITFDVQSGRYTGQRIIKAAMGELDIEEVFYLRPVGDYTDRQGKKYHYSQQWRDEDLRRVSEAAEHYARCVNERGMSEEHARGLIPFDVRQHFYVSMNPRTFMHILDMRWKKDAQLECQMFAELAFQRFQEWVPEIAQWYLESRAHKAKLAP